MLKIYNIKDKQEYIKEVAELTQKEWGKPTYSKAEFNARVSKKLCKITENLDSYKPIIILDNESRELEQLALAKVDSDLSSHTHDGQIYLLI